MPRFLCFFAVLLEVLAVSLCGAVQVTAQSQRAMALRKELGYVPYAPPKAFLDGYFIADETRPAFLFGSVADFVAARASPTAWLIETHEAARAMSLLMLIMGLAPILAPLIGGQLLAITSWRSLFWVMLAGGAMLMTAVLKIMKE